MNTVRQITVNPNDVVRELYPGVRSHITEAMPFLDKDFGDGLADQAIRHGLHRLTTERANGSYSGYLPRGDAGFLIKMMRDNGFQLGYGDGISPLSIGIAHTAQIAAHDFLKDYEYRKSVEITGQAI